MPSKLQALESLAKKYGAHPEFLGIQILSPNQRGAVDDTLLHLAARTGAIEDIKILIEIGADIDVPGDLGNTPLHQAAMSGQVEAIKLLLKCGAKKHLKNEFEQTPLDVAVLSGRDEIIRIFKL
ncbi:conserved hypothetical protein [Burkholderia sp. 8Y]|uniref:ankyrin repeat domain-containing protein n=1 Tax=Burkholderia sp. 8Y TaxID=2653133 RepID=UPI0012EF77AA|nr:ankyrin repeat domain-containing protein [Burkholderia sp. 8Y]VXB16211.1 conserved hypothetical protein [Burkholderia sp. 8Y]